MRVAQLLHLADEIGRNSVNPEGNELVKLHVVVAALFQIRHPLRGCTMNAHGDEFVRVGFVTGLANGAHHLRRHTVNAKRNELVAIRHG